MGVCLVRIPGGAAALAVAAALAAGAQQRPPAAGGALNRGLQAMAREGTQENWRRTAEWMDAEDPAAAFIFAVLYPSFSRDDDYSVFP